MTGAASHHLIKGGGAIDRSVSIQNTPHISLYEDVNQSVGGPTYVELAGPVDVAGELGHVLRLVPLEETHLHHTTSHHITHITGPSGPVMRLTGG